MLFNVLVCQSCQSTNCQPFTINKKGDRSINSGLRRNSRQPGIPRQLAQKIDWTENSTLARV